MAVPLVYLTALCFAIILKKSKSTERDVIIFCNSVDFKRCHYIFVKPRGFFQHQFLLSIKNFKKYLLNWQQVLMELNIILFYC